MESQQINQYQLQQLLQKQKLQHQQQPSFNHHQKQSKKECTVQVVDSKAHKMSLSFILNDPQAPAKDFGGIFKHTAIDKETGIEYYCFFETKEYEEFLKSIESLEDENQNDTSSNAATPYVERKRLAVKFNYQNVHLMNDDTKKTLINRILIRKIN